MNKVIFAIFLVLVGYFGVNQFNDMSAKKKARELANLEQKRILKINHDLIRKVIEETGADTSWTSKLAKVEENYPFKVLSIQIEKILKEKSPIVFFGDVEDISKINENSYKIQIARFILSPYLTSIQLDITCSATETENFLAQTKQDDFEKLVTAIVDIETVSNKTVISDGNSSDVKVATGQCKRLVNGIIE
jgi:hypothetical protein